MTQFNFKTLWGSEKQWGGLKGNGWSYTWVNCWGGGWEYQDAGDHLKSEILKIWQCSACPCTPSCSLWATQPSTTSLSILREPSCQCWRQCHGTKWILGFDLILLGSLNESEQGFDCGDTLCRASLPGGQKGGYCIYGRGIQANHVIIRWRASAYFYRNTVQICWTHRLVIGTFQMLTEVKMTQRLELKKTKELQKSKTTFLWGKTLALLIWARNWSCDVVTGHCFKDFFPLWLAFFLGVIKEFK